MYYENEIIGHMLLITMVLEGKRNIINNKNGGVKYFMKGM
jgi:hypothetical protein